MGVLFIVLGNFMGKIRPNWFVGVRTPWTLSSKLSWDKTHRLAGWLFMLMGALFALLALVQTTWMFIAVFTIDALCIAVDDRVLVPGVPQRPAPHLAGRRRRRETNRLVCRSIGRTAVDLRQRRLTERPSSSVRPLSGE